MPYVDGWVVIAEPLIDKKRTISLAYSRRDGDGLPDCYAVFLTRKKAKESIKKGPLPFHPRKIYRAAVIWNKGK